MVTPSQTVSKDGALGTHARNKCYRLATKTNKHVQKLIGLCLVCFVYCGLFRGRGGKRLPLIIYIPSEIILPKTNSLNNID